MSTPVGGAATAAAQLERLLLLVPWLVKNPGVSASQAASEFGVSQAQIERDLNLLIVCGLPGGQHGDLIDIQFWGDEEADDASGGVTADGAIHVLDAQSLTRPMALATDEAVSLLVGLSLLRELPGGIDRELIDQVMAKLQDVAGDAAGPLTAIRIEAPTAAQSASVTSVLDEALVNRQRVALTYLVPTRDEVTERIVEPQQMLLTQGHVYLKAWCLLADGERTFRVDRILSATLLDEPVEADHVVPQTDTEGSLLAGGTDFPLVTLEVTSAGRRIAEYASVASVTELPDGGLRIQVRVADDRWIERLVLQAAGAARVVAPAEIAARIVARTTEALAAYS